MESRLQNLIEGLVPWPGTVRASDQGHRPGTQGLPSFVCKMQTGFGAVLSTQASENTSLTYCHLTRLHVLNAWPVCPQGSWDSAHGKERVIGRSPEHRSNPWVTSICGPGLTRSAASPDLSRRSLSCCLEPGRLRCAQREDAATATGRGNFRGAGLVPYQWVETFLTHFTCDLLKLSDQNDFQSLCSGLDLKSCPKGGRLID